MAFKQTALERLENQIKFANKELYAELYHEIREAKEMEKHQMIQFAMELHKRDLSKTGTDILLDEAHQLYFETFVL
jgi:hypothetical protein